MPQDKKLIVTEAGYQASRGEYLQTLFIKQLLKWQYPSYAHGGPGGKGPAHFPLKDKWSIHPFLVTLEICDKLNYLSKNEIAIYILTMVRDSDADIVVKEIKNYRDEINSLDNAREKRERRFRILKAKMREVYNEEIKNGRYLKRQEDPNISKDEMIDRMIEAKMRNNKDYTDTVMRYFRFSGLFKESDRWQNLKINPLEQWKVDEILKHKSEYSKLNSNYDDYSKFYEFFGNPNKPNLPWETDAGLRRAIYENVRNSLNFLDVSHIDNNAIDISNINNHINTFNDELKKRNIELNEKICEISSDNIEELSRISEHSEKILKEVGRMVVAENFRSEDEFEVTKKMLDNVKGNIKWNEPYMEVSLLFEWALYRSIYGMGGIVLSGFGPKLNYDGTEPIFTASGKQCDVAGEFDEAYLIIEATITSGARQYDTEAEPVTRHVANFIQTKQKNKSVVCFFIARDLNENVKEFFSIYNIHHQHPIINQHLNIVPMDIDRYISFIKAIKNKNSFDGIVFRRLADGLNKLREDTKCKNCGRSEISSNDWYQRVNIIIDDALG